VAEELEVLKIVTGRLEAVGIPYMLTGSMAVSYYAVPRMTRDIDIVIEVSHADVERLTDALRDDFYLEPETLRQAIDARTTFNAIHITSVVKVDFIVRKDSEYRREEFGRRRRTAIENSTLFIAAPEDLIISKLDWARDSRSEVQLRDVRNLLAAVRDLDRSYLDRWVRHLGLQSLYREASG
jgi:hypothetical protein